MTTRMQHTVWQRYLKGWLDQDGNLNCLRDGNVFAAKTRRVMAERDFYNLEELTQEDTRALAFLLEGYTPCVRDIAIELISTVHSYFKLEEELTQHRKGELINGQISPISIRTQAIEFFHSIIEGEANPILDDLECGSSDFMRQDRSAFIFFLFLTLQHTRTTRAQDSLSKMRMDKLPFDYRKLKGWLPILTALQSSYRLLELRDDYNLVFLKNHSTLEFLTADQPIVNIAARLAKERIVPEELIFYYPIGPRLSVIYVEKGYSVKSGPVGRSFVRMMNDVMACHSHKVLVASRSASLAAYVDRVQVCAPSHIEILQHLGAHRKKLGFWRVPI